MLEEGLCEVNLESPSLKQCLPHKDAQLFEMGQMVWHHEG